VSSQPIAIPVPPLVSPELFAAAQEQLEENRQRRLGQTRRSFLLQGLLECGCCGYAFTGRRTQKYAYYGCLGGDASRWGGQKVCHNKMIRTDCLDEAIWNDVTALLQNPRLLQQEQERRREDPATATQQTKLAPQIQQAQRAVSRLIDAYQDGLLDKQEWEPRLTQARTRLDRLRTEQQRLAAAESQQATLRETLASLEQFATQIRCGLEHADSSTRREILRTLIHRIQIESHQVRITYRIRLPPFPSNERILYFCCSRERKKMAT
jgi:site-specific DNA recombinase